MVLAGLEFTDRREGGVGVLMAGASAVRYLTDGIFDFRRRDSVLDDLLVRLRLVVARVAAGTGRLKCRELPGNEFRVGLVAIGTRQVAAVILRLVGQHRVSEVRWRPCIGVVARIAFLCRQKMTRILAGRGITIVTGQTGPQNLIMIYGDDR